MAITVRQGSRQPPARFGRYLWVATLLVAVTASSATAQAPARIEEESGGMLEWALALGIAVVVCLAGFWNPKRSHQD